MKLGRLIKTTLVLTIPVMTGYIFMGMAFGILLVSRGYGVVWSGLMSVTIYAGAMQFVAVELLASPFSPLNVFFVTLIINARHIFYGISMLGKFRNTGRFKPYLVFALTDETFSLLYSAAPPEGVSRGMFYFCVSLLDQLYWVTGCVAGALIGSRISFNIKGIEFVMTALFVAIFVDQFREKSNRIPAVIGLGATALCLAVFGPDFILPAMVLLVAVLTLARKKLTRKADAE